MKKLFEPFTLGKLQLKNHIVMAPMTRSRAIDNLPNALMADYYRQRSGAGLIITEGTSPSPEGLGYPRIPGAFTRDQFLEWRKITDAVHQAGSKIFLQLMHTGRIAHIANLPRSARVVGMSRIRAAGEMYTDKEGMQEHSIPVALDFDEIQIVIDDFVKAGRNAVDAGFDGIELHGANGYLLEQALNPLVNVRSDNYSGSAENRTRLILEIVERTADVIGADKIGIRLSPYSILGDLPAYPVAEVHQTYNYLSAKLQKRDIAYIHISDSPAIAEQTRQAIRENFFNTLIYCNGLTAETAEARLQDGSADLVAFGRGFLANPDFVERLKKNQPLNEPDYMTLYTPGEQGYTDYPTLH